jgi:hypothetical protein
MVSGSLQPCCVVCGIELPGSHFHRMFCSIRCKSRHERTKQTGRSKHGHSCRVCGTIFPIGKGQHNKWLCSSACRKKSVARSVRNFHERKPAMEAIYRARTKEKKYPDNSLIRFYKWNSYAPRKCESCGENRVLEIAHKPGHERFGSHRSSTNSCWPEHVWVLCPTCHRLIDRMNYPPSELGLV